MTAMTVPVESVPARRVLRFEARAMASPLRLTVEGSEPAGAACCVGATPEGSLDLAARAAWSRVVETFETAEEAMSRFRGTSELMVLNRLSVVGAGSTASRMLVGALVAADRAHRLTGGRFDPRVLGDLERLGYVGAPRPVLAAPDPPAALAGQIVERDGRHGHVRLPVAVDLGGIGKGLALRWAARAAEETLAPLLDGGGFLLEAGGDLVTRGVPAGGSAWNVDIEDPSGATDALAVVAVPADGAIATSSIRLNHWTTADGRPAHHLIDPRTGEPGGAGLLSVTVAGADPAWAEVWSKTLFLEGAASIGAAARGRGLAAWWVDANGCLEMTPAARVRTLWTAPEARSS